MKYSFVLVLVVIGMMCGELVTAERIGKQEIEVQYSAPVDGHYAHGDHCVDGRVF